jgi:hypothetical protein
MDVPLLPGSCPRTLPAISHQTRTLLTAVSRLSRSGSWSSLYSLDTNRTENIASNSSSVVACVSVAVITRWLLSHRLATGVFTEPFPNNDLWLSGVIPQYIMVRYNYGTLITSRKVMYILRSKWNLRRKSVGDMSRCSKFTNNGWLPPPPQHSLSVFRLIRS